jgi:hypothetical protein
MLFYLFLKIINIFTGLDALGSHMTCLDVCMHKQHIICTKLGHWPTSSSHDNVELIVLIL